MQLAILADTHVPSRADAIPDWVREAVRAADHVVHAGDFDSQETYDQIADLSAELTAVRGNMDPELDPELPETTTVELGGVRFVVTHGTGPIEDNHDRVVGIVREVVADTDDDLPLVGVSGHTHHLVDETVESEDRGDSARQTPFAPTVRLLNPGSATGADPAEFPSMYLVEVEDGDLEVHVEKHE
ncbi:metallophosphoesterase family protein [Halomarina litorea]|uniref:metallophosphoesterase family protein n=1 Tax=Halomarina litorea TaxID=2961595 RepID=UPI0020C295BC|nr:metallophosphoesterase family protein [Halomarina sp. BCD28]